MANEESEMTNDVRVVRHVRDKRTYQLVRKYMDLRTSDKRKGSGGSFIRSTLALIAKVGTQYLPFCTIVLTFTHQAAAH